jgi:hypothetical protein
MHRAANVTSIEVIADPSRRASRGCICGSQGEIVATGTNLSRVSTGTTGPA